MDTPTDTPVDYSNVVREVPTPVKSAPSLDGLTLLKERANEEIPHTIARHREDLKALRVLEQRIQETTMARLMEPENAAVKAVAEQLEEAHRKFVDEMSTITFHIKPVDKLSYQAMIMACLPSEAQIEKLRETTGDPDATLDVDPEKFIPMVVEACVTRVTFSDGTPEIGPITDEVAAVLCDGKTVSWNDLVELKNQIVNAHFDTSAVNRLGKG